jgi:hypothetical protein
MEKYLPFTAALAREICQNSIDAQCGELSTRVEFELFEINRDGILGISELSKEINKCYDFKKDSSKEAKSLKQMNKWINKEKIKCLRISDFNTTGLLGVGTNERGKPFYNLTRGSGVSDKLGTSGGSKGIGKFASFVASTTNTVFYSTKTKEQEKGYIGISKLRSIPIKDDDLDLMTMGIGYYGRNKKNEPILESLKLDPDFQRSESEFGTDVYLIGFNDKKGWQNDIIAKILDSFMVAIMHNGFEVIVDGVVINKKTIGAVLSNDDIFSKRYKREVKDIRAQYELLNSNEGITSRDLFVGESNKVTLYVKQYKQEEEKDANKRCIMVRYPYMKIKHITGSSYLPYSALCVIHDNDLNSLLREIENPQHTDWEIKRLNEYPEEKERTNKLKKEMEEAINSSIKEILRQNDTESTDVEGAGDFLPAQEEGTYTGEKIQVDTVTVSPLKRNKKVNPKTKKSGELGEGYDFDDGSNSGNEGGKIPGDNLGEPNPNPGETQPPKDEDRSVGNDGKESVLKKVALSGMKYKNIVVDKNIGRFDIIFDSLYDEKNCELEIKMCGEGNDKYSLNIIAASMDNVECSVDNGKIIGLRINKGQKYKIACKLDINELFASEVILNAYR